jgi:2,3-bisphosphoglycerate-dependent phosphoglycerate mutase
MKTNVYMIRHAESPFVFGEERTRGLSEEGLRMAMKVADLLESVEIQCVVSSSYTRAIQTVQIVAQRKRLPILEVDELKERSIKGLDYKAPWEELERAIERSFVDHDFCLDGGESTKQAQRRAIPILLDLLKNYEGKNIALGTHGNIMTIMMNYFDSRYGFGFWNRTTKPDIYRLEFMNDRLTDVERIWET